MEFIERADLTRLHYLITMTFKDYKQHTAGSSAKNDDERKKNFDKMKSYVSSMIKASGEMKRLYKFTGGNNWNDDGTGSGRLFAHAGGVQGLAKLIRGFLFQENTTDIDMCNAHPTILRYLCLIHNIICDELTFYIEHRDEVLAQFSDRDEGKTLFLKATNDERVNRKTTNEVLKRYDKEMKRIQKQLTNLTCYANIVKQIPEDRLYNWHGSAINKIMCYYENRVLQVIIREMNKKNIEITAPMFDGALVYGNLYGNRTMLTELENAIEAEFPGMNMKLSYKEHKTTIVMPDDFTIPATVEALNTFEKVAKEFEKTHCKITNKSIFIKEISLGLESEIIVMSKPDLKTSYEHMVFQKLSRDNEVVNENFITAWTRNNASQRCFEDIGIYPDGVACPQNAFNLWRKFAMENVTEYEHKEEELQTILSHIKVLCNNQDDVYDYFVKWIAQMIQFPAVKTICPTLISEEGAGKGSLLKLLSAMLGKKKVFETREPSRDVWGEFNSRLADAFLVNLNELSQKDTLDAEGKIKGLITDSALTINPKGVGKYEITSYHRFLITTNKEDPVKTHKGDRRNLIIRSSDELVGNKEYFTRLHVMLDDVNVVKTCYEYFKSVEGVDKFNEIPIPQTEHQTNLKKLGASPVEQWLESFTLENYDKDTVEMLGTEAFEKFKHWLTSNNTKYEINAIKFGVRLSNLKLSAITKGKHTNKGETKIYNIVELKKHFNIGCLVEWTADNQLDDEE